MANNIEFQKMRHQLELEIGLAVITLGQNALKGAVLINGGAAVALLAFIGNIWNAGVGKESVKLLANSMQLFTYGVLSAAMAGGATYCCQHLYQINKVKFGVAFQIIAILLVIASYYFFYSGSQSAYDAFIL